jgi:hypothetical protein
MANCVTCGRELHPERAEKYDYCTDPECQKRNAKGLTIVALGVNKAADQYRVLDERTREMVASGAYVEEATSGKELAGRQASPRRRDRRGGDQGSGERGRSERSGGRGRPARADLQRPVGSSAAPGWTKAQEDLALIYNQRGMRPDEIAGKLGISTYTATQMILAARNRAKP